MGVSCDVASTTTLVVLEGETQVCDGPQSCEGGHPPQVCPHPSSPHVLLAQLEAQATPPSGPAPPDPPEAAAPPLPDLPPAPAAPPLPADAPATPPAPPRPLPPDAPPLPPDPPPLP